MSMLLHCLGPPWMDLSDCDVILAICREEDSSDEGQRRSKHAKTEPSRGAEDQPAKAASTDPILDADAPAKAAADAAAADALAEGVLGLEVVEAEAAELFR